MKEAQSALPTRNWATTLMFGLTFAAAVTVVPWYGFTHGYSAAAWVCGALLLGANGMAITCGYHRLFAHSSYGARSALKLVYLLFGAMALQSSALNWSADHRAHHRYIDDPERDPYCARRGFWFSHIGWMLRHYPSGKADWSCVRDLQREPLVMWQHRYYIPLILVMNIGLPLLLGWACGDIVGMFLLAGILRLVVSHHATFFINSLAHMWGAQPYSEDNTARDNGIVALLTYGGYEEAQGVRQRLQVSFVLAWAQFHFLWCLLAPRWRARRQASLTHYILIPERAVWDTAQSQVCCERSN